MSTDIRFAEPEDAPALLELIRAAFSARPALDPPAEALADTVDDVRSAIEGGHGVVVERDGFPVACLLVTVEGDTATLRRVSVLPAESGSGVGREMVSATLVALADLGLTHVQAFARREFPRNVEWWERAGFVKAEAASTGWMLRRTLPISVDVPDADAMRALGRELAAVLRAGDVIVATGGLGAGKTTLTQGIGAGLDVDGPVISPTFVISRIHPSRGDGPDLVHVDAYRLGSAEELGDIDLEETLARSVTIVEWGRGLAEWLAPDRLEIEIERSDDPADDLRTVHLFGIGPRWDGVLEHLRKHA